MEGVIELETKICSLCKIEKPLTAEYFSKSKNGKGGFNSRCKECRHKKNKDYREKNRERDLARKKKYREENKEKVANYLKEYFIKNKKEVAEYKKRYRKENKDKIQIYRVQYKQRESTKALNKIRRHRRKARKKQVINSLTSQQWEITKQYFNNCCAYCGKETAMTMDHFIPLSKMGELSINNIIPVCFDCNSGKRDRDFFEWYPRQEFYSKKREKKILKYLGYSKKKIQELSLFN